MAKDKKAVEEAYESFKRNSAIRATPEQMTAAINSFVDGQSKDKARTIITQIVQMVKTHKPDVLVSVHERTKAGKKNTKPTSGGPAKSGENYFTSYCKLTVHGRDYMGPDGKGKDGKPLVKAGHVSGGYLWHLSQERYNALKPFIISAKNAAIKVDANGKKGWYTESSDASKWIGAAEKMFDAIIMDQKSHKSEPKPKSGTGRSKKANDIDSLDEL